jgi:hypothetical protein
MVIVKDAPPEVAEAGVRLVSMGDAAHAAGAPAKTRVAEATTVNHRRKERAYCIRNSYGRRKNGSLD